MLKYTVHVYKNFDAKDIEFAIILFFFHYIIWKMCEFLALYAID